MLYNGTVTRNFNKLLINALLSTTVLLGSSLLAQADTWEIKGLEAPTALGEAEAAFNNVRRAQKEIGDTPQNAIDTISSIEEELFALNKKISDGISAYNIREDAMEDDIANNENLMDIEVERVKAERQRLNARQDQILSAMNRIADNDPTAEQLAQLRAEFDLELAKIKDDIEKLRFEETNVRNALNRRATQRQLELDELQANIPNPTELMAIKERLRLAQRIGFETDEELSKLREQEHATATAYLQELLANTPEYLTNVKASFKGDVFYDGKWVPDGAAEASTQAEKDAIAEVLAKEEENLATLENSTKVWRGTVRDLGQAIKFESDSATQLLNLIADEQIRTLYINMGLEIGGTIAGSLASGGAAGLIKFASESNRLARGVAIARRNVINVPYGVGKYVTEIITADVSKYINTRAVEALEVADNIYDLGYKLKVNKNTGLRSNAAILVAGDLSEMAVSMTIGGITGAVKNGITGLAKTAVPPLTTAQRAAAELAKSGPSPTVKILRGAGIDLATTGLKSAVIARAQSLNNQRAKDYVEAHATAEALHGAFLEAKGIWLRLDAVTKAHKELVEALRLRAENGPEPLTLDKTGDSGGAAKGDEIEIELEFSKPMIAPPTISGEGLSFGDAKESDASKRRWKLIATLDDELTEVQLDIGLDKRERPFFLLDSNPSTPPRLASLLKDHWQSYEAGTDTNHVLNFGLTPITFCGGVNALTEPDKLKSILGEVYPSLMSHVKKEIAQHGSPDGKKVWNENTDPEVYGLSVDDLELTLSAFMFNHANVAVGTIEFNSAKDIKIIPPANIEDYKAKHNQACTMIANLPPECVPGRARALIDTCK